MSQAEGMGRGCSGLGSLKPLDDLIHSVSVMATSRRDFHC